MAALKLASVQAWLRRSIGRARHDSKMHLLESAEVLNFSHHILDRMRAATDEACEKLFLEEIVAERGGPVDWRAKPGEVLAVLEPFLTPEERARARTMQLPLDSLPPDAARKIAAVIGEGRVGIRILDSFGDFFIVLLVPRSALERFDRANVYWSE